MSRQGQGCPKKTTDRRGITRIVERDGGPMRNLKKACSQNIHLNESESFLRRVMEDEVPFDTEVQNPFRKSMNVMKAGGI